MKPINQIPIKESIAELEGLYKSSSDFLKPRIKMFIILSKEPVTTKSKLARRLDVAYNSISKWHELYSTGGMEKLLEVKRGKYRSPDRRTMGFPPEIYTAIETRHKNDPFQSYVELHAWIKNKHLPEIKYSTLIKYIELYFGDTLRIARTLHLPIKESVHELEAIHTRCLLRIKPRIKMLLELKHNDKISRFELANKLKVSYGSIIKWSNIYRRGGIKEMLKYKLKLVITPEVLNHIEKQFQQGRFRNFSELYREVSRDYLPGIKYYTLHRYVHRHFAVDLDAAKALHMPIKETEVELVEIHMGSSADKKQRIQMLLSLKVNPGYTKIELAKLSGVAVGSIHRWFKLYRQGGIDCMLEIKMRGRKKLELPVNVHRLIEKKLRNNPEMNITELHEWVKSVYATHMTYNKLYRYVRRHFVELPKVNYTGRITEARTFNRVA